MTDVTVSQDVVKRAIELVHSIVEDQFGVRDETNLTDAWYSVSEKNAQEIIDFARDLSSLTRTGEAEPVGWKLVPVEPTDEMLKAAWSLHATNGRNVAQVVYNALLAAAPAHPATPVIDDAAVERFMTAMFGEVTPGNTQTWVNPDRASTAQKVRAALLAAQGRREE